MRGTWLLLGAMACAPVPPAVDSGRVHTWDGQPGVASTVYLVRHAEKDSGADPPLTAPGELRAEALADLLVDVPLAGVYSTDTARTRATAFPTAVDHRVPVALYAGEEVFDAILPVGGHHLVVGHSNTVVGLVEALGGDGGDPISSAEYDRLYVVAVAADGEAQTTLLRYGAAEDTGR